MELLRQGLDLAAVGNTPRETERPALDKLAPDSQQYILDRHEPWNEAILGAHKLGLEPVQEVMVAGGAAAGMTVVFLPNAGPLELGYGRSGDADRL